MFRKIIFFLIAGFIVLPAIIKAQDNSQEEMSPEQKIWMDYMTPSEAHQMMAKFEGDWKTNIKMWMDPNADPQVFEGTTHNEMILGGRYIKSVNKSIMMGMPFEGVMIEGFDNDKKEYTSIWIDNFGTGTMISKGKYDDETGKVIMYGTSYDPVKKEDVKFKQTFEHQGDNKMVMEMFMVDENGQETKSMEINYSKD